ncbi:hypothetical protein CH375_15535 [Leptospira ellisii]|nr:hypothetical protein CH375_15535 [Leptospira ellisii]
MADSPFLGTVKWRFSFINLLSDSVTLVRRDYVTLRKRKNDPKRFFALRLPKIQNFSFKKS